VKNNRFCYLCSLNFTSTTVIVVFLNVLRTHNAIFSTAPLHSNNGVTLFWKRNESIMDWSLSWDNIIESLMNNHQRFIEKVFNVNSFGNEFKILFYFICEITELKWNLFHEKYFHRKQVKQTCLETERVIPANRWAFYQYISYQ
jgi:hypothetical protein